MENQMTQNEDDFDIENIPGVPSGLETENEYPAEDTGPAPFDETIDPGEEDGPTDPSLIELWGFDPDNDPEFDNSRPATLDEVIDQQLNDEEG
jgi:hypothetical protein